MIKDINIKELTGMCVDLLMRTYTELGQTPSEQVVLLMSQSLANDLKQDFGKLYFEDIVQSFREGVRNTDKFSINVKTYYSWIKAHRQLIWGSEGKNIHQLDKRLKYRKRIGTGTKKIDNQINQIITKKLNNDKN